MLMASPFTMASESPCRPQAARTKSVAAAPKPVPKARRKSFLFKMETPLMMGRTQTKSLLDYAPHISHMFRFSSEERRPNVRFGKHALLVQECLVERGLRVAP